MRIKKRLVKKDNYYEYSSDYVKKYIIIAIFIILLIIAVFLSIYLPYNIVPNKSFMKNDTPEATDDNIMDERGIYYTGDFTNIPKSIPISENMKENLYLYLFHDNHIIFWKFYKYGEKRYFSYNAFNILDKDAKNFAIKEESKDFLDYYDNFTRAQFRKAISKLELEIPSFYNSSISFQNSIDDLIEAQLSFRFTNFNASMINWGKNRGLYAANYYNGFPRGYMIVPGSDNIINSASSVLAINTAGRIPSRYEHNILTALIYIPYTIKPIPIFIYESKPQSQNSKIIKFLYNNKWYVYNDFISHESKESVDFYSKEDGFSFVYTVKSEYIEDSFGSFRKVYNKISFGSLTGYFTIGSEQFNINGNGVSEFAHSVF